MPGNKFTEDYNRRDDGEQRGNWNMGKVLHCQRENEVKSRRRSNAFIELTLRALKLNSQ